MVDNVKNAIEVAIASNETIYTDMITETATGAYTITWPTSGALSTVGWTSLDAEVQKTIDITDTRLTSKTMIGTVPTITIDATGDVKANLPTAP